MGQNGLMNELQKRMVEAMLDGELTNHLGYAPHNPAGYGIGNSCNGYSAKKVQSKDGELQLEVPRDRNGRFGLQVLRKGQSRMDGMDEMIIALYARGLSTRGIQEELKEMYGAEVSPTLISNVTHSVLKEVQAWQVRALDPVCPIIYLDCLFVKSRQDGSIRNQTVYRALDINLMVYTTNAIESLNFGLRKIIKGRCAFPHDDAIRKLLYLGLKNASKKWTLPVRDWKAALNQFIILFGDRVPV